MAVDMVCTEFRDMKALEEESKVGVQLGFTGKQVIHPAQIDIVNKSFSPDSEALKLAEAIVQQYELHSGEGRGAFDFCGKVVDRPGTTISVIYDRLPLVYLQAKKLLESAHGIGKSHQ